MQSGSTSHDMCKASSSTKPDRANAADPMPSKQLRRMTFSGILLKPWLLPEPLACDVGGCPFWSGVVCATPRTTPCCPYFWDCFQSEDHESLDQFLSSDF